ncbi:MAG: YicC family protein [Phycisphaerales bacterium]|nr:YicC family protein [Phycisphaerales bacterium]
MIQSMTGYGAAHHTENGVDYALEVRSLNNRYFKTSIKLPESMQSLEPEVEKLLRSRLQRGSVTYVMRLRSSGASGAYAINADVVAHYLSQIQDLKLPAGVEARVELASLLSMPGVCQAPEQDDDSRAAIWAIVERMTGEALDKLTAMRRAEGQALRSDLLSQCDRIRELATEVATRAPTVIQEYQQKLRDRVAKLVADAKIEVDRESLIREVAIYADRCDVNEEITRLASHLVQFAKFCDSPELAGRKLDFLTQEMLREANTIGSKSNDAFIAARVVEIKGSIDRLKEQVQNVE